MALWRRRNRRRRRAWQPLKGLPIESPWAFLSVIIVMSSESERDLLYYLYY